MRLPTATSTCCARRRSARPSWRPNGWPSGWTSCGARSRPPKVRSSNIAPRTTSTTSTASRSTSSGCSTSTSACPHCAPTMPRRRPKWRQIRAMRSSGFDATEAVPEVLASMTIINLRERETQLLKEESDLRSTYGTKHPRIVSIQQETATLQRKIQAEVGADPEDDRERHRGHRLADQGARARDRHRLGRHLGRSRGGGQAARAGAGRRRVAQHLQLVPRALQRDRRSAATDRGRRQGGVDRGTADHAEHARPEAVRRGRLHRVADARHAPGAVDGALRQRAAQRAPGRADAGPAGAGARAAARAAAAQVRSRTSICWPSRSRPTPNRCARSTPRCSSPTSTTRRGSSWSPPPCPRKARPPWP